mgnify:FL=1
MKRLILFVWMINSLCLLMAEGRKVTMLTSGWEFSFDQRQWQKVDIPHDWAISGPFDKKWDLQTVAIEQNGEKQATEKSGRSGSLPWIGKGYYRRMVEIPAEAAKAELVFDGAMSEPHVFVNGKLAGEWAYGYNTFRIDITPYMIRGGENKLEVHLNNLEESSRWYPGAGIYRPVWLQLYPAAHIDEWHTFARTSFINNEMAGVDIDTQLRDIDDDGIYAVEIRLLDNEGQTVGASHCDVPQDGKVSTSLHVRDPKLWTPEHPYLYKVRVQLFKNRRLVDEYVHNTGIRTIRVDKENGFQLNGVSRKIQGVCLHHDLGPLGAAVSKAALIRQIKTMKEMGADAIRTSHNMPSQWQMDICDSLGMMVMAESFDMWIYPKCKNGYARFFREWSDKDITNLVLAHRNHPSIIMWSIGNEIPEQWSEEGREISRHLQDLCHQLDPTRPVTQGLDRADEALKSGFAQVMDVPGFNYRVYKYPNNIKQLPKGFLLGSETASTVSSRGVYKLPVVVSNHQVYADGQCSGYDTEYCSWSNLPEADFAAMDDLPYTIGQFVWTGYDYLGEPTPYDEYWPSRSSYFGICDLAGLPKDRYYLYRSVWNREQHTLHLLPHWTWDKSLIGNNIPVYCYTDYPSAELFVNGKSYGRLQKQDIHDAGFDGGGAAYLDRYRLRWNDVVYVPGELKVVAYDKEGRAADEKIVKTAGQPDKLLLQCDRRQIMADGQDLSFITVSLADGEGTLIPDGDDPLTFSVTGNGVFQAVCNGDATSLESFTQPTMRLFHGQLVVIVRSTATPGIITLRVKDSKRDIQSEIQITTH